MRALVIVGCMVLAVVTASLSCALTFGARVWHVGDQALISTPYALSMERFNDLASMTARWRGRWQRRTTEPTTPDAICGRVRRAGGCFCFPPGRRFGPFFFDFGKGASIRALTDCSKPVPFEGPEPTPEHEGLAALRCEIQRYALAPWGADTWSAQVVAQLPQARRLLVALALVSAYPTFAFLRGPVRRIRRRRRGLCASCGYDLTGNVSGRCPECGSPIRAPSASAGSA